MRWVGRILGITLMAVGLVLVLGTGGVLGYGAYQRYLFDQQMAVQATGEVMATPTPSPTPEPTQPPPTGTAGPTAIPTATPTATATPVPLPPKRIIAPSIDLDSPVVKSVIKDGQWQVPKFVAGHLEGTANPGEGSNVALSGHLESISSGNVFARIGELRPGDEIFLQTATRQFNYVVKESLVVKNTDLSVVQPTPEERLTLITCTGTWLPLQRDYDSRSIIVAELVSQQPLG